jgi:hypothetical protein
MKVKLDSKNTLCVVQRIRAVIQLRLVEDPTAKMSVSEVCRLANVNRAGLYANHPALVDEIKGGGRSPPKESCKKLTKPEKRKPLFNSETAEALLYLCLELQMEVKALRAVVPNVPAKRKVKNIVKIPGK